MKQTNEYESLVMTMKAMINAGMDSQTIVPLVLDNYQPKQKPEIVQALYNSIRAQPHKHNFNHTASLQALSIQMPH